MHFRQRACEEQHALGEGGALRAVCAPDGFCALGINSFLTPFKTLQPGFAFFGGCYPPVSSAGQSSRPKPRLCKVRTDATVRRASLAYLISSAFRMKSGYASDLYLQTDAGCV